ncbi:hypothetical protein BDF19DRAFT_423491 [Syncephalis fuscata]|nr:hypothetical protein BDF19DRAFT_423491 [Syncephalis fuscata]
MTFGPPFKRDDYEQPGKPLEQMLFSQLPADVNRLWLLTLEPRDVSQLMRTSTRCYTAIANNSVLWRIFYLKRFMNKPFIENGEGLDHKEEEWLMWALKSLAEKAALSSHDGFSAQQATQSQLIWALLYQQRMIVERRLASAEPNVHHVAMPQVIMPASTPKTKLSQKPTLLASGANGGLLTIGGQWFWISLQPDASVKSMLLRKKKPAITTNVVENQNASLSKIIFSSITPEWIVVVEESSVVRKGSVARRNSTEYTLIAWSLSISTAVHKEPVRAECGEEDGLSYILSHQTAILEPYDNVQQILGPWVLLSRPQGKQGGSIPMLFHLPSGKLIVETKRKPGASYHTIQTFSDSLVYSLTQSGNHANRQNEQPSATILSIFMHRDVSEIEDNMELSKDFLHWNLTKYYLPKDNLEGQYSTETKMYSSGELAKNRVNSKSIWLERVDHQRALVRFRLLGPSAPQIMLIQSANSSHDETEDTVNTSILWTQTFDPKSIHACASRSIVLAISKTDMLNVYSLATGEQLYSVDCFQRSYGEAGLAAHIFHLQPGSRHDLFNKGSGPQRGLLGIVAFNASNQDPQPRPLSVQPLGINGTEIAKSLGEPFIPAKAHHGQIHVSAACIVWIENPPRRSGEEADKSKESIVIASFV